MNYFYYITRKNINRCQFLQYSIGFQKKIDKKMTDIIDKIVNIGALILEENESEK